MSLSSFFSFFPTVYADAPEEKEQEEVKEDAEEEQPEEQPEAEAEEEAIGDVKEGVSDSDCGLISAKGL